MTVEAYSGETENDKDADYKFKDTGYGITYTVTPGTDPFGHPQLWSTNNAAAATTVTNTAVALNVSF